MLRPLGVTVLLVTHDREEAFSLADRIALMRDGAIEQVGTPEELYFAPATRWAAEFLGAGTCSRRVDDGAVHTPIGRRSRANGGSARRVEVLVRPELLELAPDPAGAARSSRASSAATTSSTASCSTASSSSRSGRRTRSSPLGARVSVRLARRARSTVLD